MARKSKSAQADNAAQVTPEVQAGEYVLALYNAWIASKNGKLYIASRAGELGARGLTPEAATVALERGGEKRVSVFTHGGTDMSLKAVYNAVKQTGWPTLDVAIQASGLAVAPRTGKLVDTAHAWFGKANGSAVRTAAAPVKLSPADMLKALAS